MREVTAYVVPGSPLLAAEAVEPDMSRNLFRETYQIFMDLETWFKIHTNTSNVEIASPQNHINS